MKKYILFLITILIAYQMQAQTPEERLKEKGIVLTTPSAPVATYVNVVRVGNLLFLSGKGPNKPDGSYVIGKVGKDLTIEQGYEAARWRPSVIFRY